MANTPYYTKAETDAIESNLRRQYSYEGAGYQGSLTSASAVAPTSDGLYLPLVAGTYTNFGGLVVSLTNKFPVISVESGQTVFRLFEATLTIPIDAVPTSGSTNVPQSGGTFDAIAAETTARNLALAEKQDNLTFDETPNPQIILAAGAKYLFGNVLLIIILILYLL